MCDQSPVWSDPHLLLYLYLLPLLHTHHTLQHSSHPDLECFCLQDFAKAVSCIWDVFLRDPPSLSSFLQTFQISPFFFLLPHLNHLYFLYCPFCFGGVLCIQHAAITPSIVIISCLSSPVRLCAPWGQGLGLSDHRPPIRIRQMTGYQMVNVLE